MKKRYLGFLFLALIYLIYISFRIDFFLNLSTTITNDTSNYVEVARIGFFTKEFWTEIRPFTYPLFIKMFNFNLDAIVTGQFIISLLAWLLLAYGFSRILTTYIMRILAFTFILLFSLSTDVMLWNRLVQTESLNISMIVIFFSMIFYNMSHTRKIPIYIFLILSFFWTFLRDTNAWMVLFFGLIWIIYALLNKLHWSKLIITPILIVFFLLSNYSAAIGQRWAVPFLNVLSTRVLPNNDTRYEFRLRGMPENDALLEQKNKTFSPDYFTNPELEGFRQWLVKNGKRSYISFLLRNPSYFIQAPFENWSLMFGYLPSTQDTTNDNLDYAPNNFKEVIPFPISEIIYPKKHGLMFVLISLLLIGILLSRYFEIQSNVGLLFCLAVLICCFPLFILIYHGDSSGISRHAVGAILPAVLATWLLIIQFVDRIAKKSGGITVEDSK